MSCPALHILRGCVYTQGAGGRLTPRDPECAIDPETGRCRYCHITARTDASVAGDWLATIARGEES